MDPITIAKGLEIVLQLVSAIQTAHASGSTVVDPATWAEAIAGRKADQQKLDDDIAKQRATP